MKKYCNKKNIFIASLALIIIIYFISILVFGNKSVTLINQPYDNLLKKQPRLQDDFYDNINYKYLSKNKLKEDEDFWYYMYTDASESIKKEKHKIIEDILKKCDTYPVGSINNKICIFHDSYNKKNNDKEIKKELNNYINLINNSKTIEEYINTVLKINKELSVGILVNPMINFQPDNLKKPYFNLENIYYDYHVYNNEYYSLESFEQELNKLRKYDVKLLKLYGYKDNEAYKMIDNIHSMYKEIARFSIKSTKMLDKGYKVYSINELQSKLKKLNLNLIIQYYSDIYLNDGNILVSDINQLTAIDDYLDKDNLNILKEYATLRIITEYSNYLGEEFYKLNEEFEENFNYVEYKEVSDKEIMYETIYSLFQDTIVKEFANRNFSEEEKVFYTNLILEEIKIFKERISNEDWLSLETKTYALDKMDKIKYTVGILDNLVYTEKNYDISNNKSYLSNIININKVITKEYNKQYGSGNILYNIIDPLEQNAYYEANTNSINILLGMIYSYKKTLNLDVKNLDKHYYELLGTCGATIGHELTHALDSNGSKYDAYGNYINWWTDKDKENFNRLNIDVVKYFNKYNQFGSTTLGENIADLGGMAIIMDIAKKKNATNADYKKIFEYYTLDWCSQKTPYAKAYLLYFDEHSPDKNRVNAILSSTDEFYSTYLIKENDGMYVSVKDRVRVW